MTDPTVKHFISIEKALCLCACSFHSSDSRNQQDKGILYIYINFQRRRQDVKLRAKMMVVFSELSSLKPKIHIQNSVKHPLMMAKIKEMVVLIHRNRTTKKSSLRLERWLSDWLAVLAEEQSSTPSTHKSTNNTPLTPVPKGSDTLFRLTAGFTQHNGTLPYMQAMHS